MKFKVNSESLSKALDRARKVISAKSTVPSLDNYLFQVAGGNLVVTASDMTLTYVGTVALEECGEEGGACIRPDTLDGLLKNLTPQTLEFEQDSSNGGAAMLVTWADGQAVIPVFPDTDFPSIAMPEGEPSLEIEQKDLVRALRHTAFAMSDEQTRPALAAVFFDVRPGGLTLVASDSHKLVLYDCPAAIKDAGKGGLVVPKRCVQFLKGAFDGEGPVGVIYDGSAAVFATPGQKISTTLVKSSFPKYSSVVPQNTDRTVTADKRILSEAIKRMATYADRGNRLVTLSLSDGSLSLRASDPGYSVSASERVPAAAVEGDDMDIAFKSGDLAELAEAFDSASLVVSMSAPNRAALIAPAGDDGAKEPFKAVLMPYMAS